MSKYSTTYENVIMSFLTNEGFTFDDARSQINKRTSSFYNALKECFALGDYPIFNETYRNTLNYNIFNFYRFTEIGQETIALHRHFINQTMFLKMPYYNKLYESEIYEIDPFITKDYLETYDFDRKQSTAETDDTKTNQKNKSEQIANQTLNNTTSGNSSSSDDSLNVFSKTPQNMLQIGNIKNNTYASEATYVDTKGTATSTTKGDSTGKNELDVSGTQDTTSNKKRDVSLTDKQDYSKHVKGYDGNKANLLADFRNNFLNIDNLVIEELGSCFILIF